MPSYIRTPPWAILHLCRNKGKKKKKKKLFLFLIIFTTNTIFNYSQNSSNNKTILTEN